MLATTLAGCGGSTSSSLSARQTSSGSSTSSSVQSTGAKTSTTTATGAHTSTKSRVANTHGAGKAKLHATVYNPKSKQSGGTGTGTIGKGSTSAQDPCSFVTRVEAQTILHAQVQREIEAPLGPTCIIEVRGEKQSITLAVEAIDVPRDIAQMKKKPTQLSIGGRTAYCGTLGSSLLFVELGGGRVLEVVAPCAAAEALAAKALPRIKA